MTNTNDNKNLTEAEIAARLTDENGNRLPGKEWLNACLELGLFDDVAPTAEVTHDIMF